MESVPASMTLLSPDTPSTQTLATVHNTVKNSTQKESFWGLVLQVSLMSLLSKPCDV